MTALAPNKETRSANSWSVEDLAAAETCRYYLDAYGKWVHGHKPVRHQRVWIDRIVDLVEGRTAKRKLLIIAPPGHAKSTWISLIFPPWYLGKYPEHSILFFTSSDTMAGQFGGTVKATLEENAKHRLTFPNYQPDYKRGWSSNGLYLTTTPSGSKDPAYRAIGYGASSIGARANGIILDDPLTQEQAQSPTVQATIKEYQDMTVDTRLQPDGWMLAIMTAWHELDLRAHLASKDDWDLLLMPALGYWGEGTALWDERFPVEWLRQKQKDLGGARFACVYQGDPTSMGGSVFKSAAWFRALPSDFDEPREDGRTFRSRLPVVQYWDLAWSSKQTADYTASCTASVDSAKNLYITNAHRFRVDDTQLDQAMADHILLTRPRVVGVEVGAFKQAATQDLIRRVNRILAASGFACAVVGVDVTTDKVFRARLPAARAEAGMIYADKTAPWYPTFEAECLGFPLAAHDDFVDAFSGVTQLAIEKLSTNTAKEQSYTVTTVSRARQEAAVQRTGVAVRLRR